MSIRGQFLGPSSFCFFLFVSQLPLLMFSSDILALTFPQFLITPQRTDRLYFIFPGCRKMPQAKVLLICSRGLPVSVFILMIYLLSSLPKLSILTLLAFFADNIVCALSCSSSLIFQPGLYTSFRIFSNHHTSPPSSFSNIDFLLNPISCSKYCLTPSKPCTFLLPQSPQTLSPVIPSGT